MPLTAAKALSYSLIFSCALALSACGSSPDPAPENNDRPVTKRDQQQTSSSNQDVEDDEEEEVLSAEERAARRRGLMGRASEKKETPEDHDPRSATEMENVESSDPAAESSTSPSMEGGNTDASSPNLSKEVKLPTEEQPVKEADPAKESVESVEAKPVKTKPADTSALDPALPQLGDDHEAEFLAWVAAAEELEKTFGNDRTQANYDDLYVACLTAKVHELYLLVEVDDDSSKLSEEVQRAGEALNRIFFSTRKTAGFDQKSKPIKKFMERKDKVWAELYPDE